MHSIRSKEDGRGNTLMPNAGILVLQDVPKFGIEVIFENNNCNWTGVVTNPGLFCKDKLS